MPKDPVCGREVPQDSKFHLGYWGQKVLFCSATCEYAFKEEPERYVDVDAYRKYWREHISILSRS